MTIPSSRRGSDDFACRVQRAAFPELGERKPRHAAREIVRASRQADLRSSSSTPTRLLPIIPWSRYGVRGGNRNAAGQHLELNDAECVGSAEPAEKSIRQM